MGYNDRYWNNKENRAKEAVKHTEYMAETYKKEIDTAVAQTRTYMEDVKVQGRFIQVNRKNKYVAEITEPEHTETNVPKIIVDDLDSVTALFKYNQGRTCVLNFASFRYPGGKFIEGSKAQEECLCHESFLYNVLKVFKDFYAFNESYRNKGMYSNRALYSPQILFERQTEGIKLEADVLTCAAPNKSAYDHYIDIAESVKQQTNYDTLCSRIHFIRLIAEENNVETFILGAYGCGVFKQDALQVAQIFKKEFEYTTIKNLVYAVPSGMDKENYLAFCRVFGTIC